jgi:hypothetical protein
MVLCSVIPVITEVEIRGLWSKRPAWVKLAQDHLENKLKAEALGCGSSGRAPECNSRKAEKPQINGCVQAEEERGEKPMGQTELGCKPAGD